MTVYDRFLPSYCSFPTDTSCDVQISVAQVCIDGVQVEPLVLGLLQGLSGNGPETVEQLGWAGKPWEHHGKARNMNRPGQ